MVIRSFSMAFDQIAKYSLCSRQSKGVEARAMLQAERSIVHHQSVSKRNPTPLHDLYGRLPRDDRQRL
jgi:hypothetical protein